jgi:hypothetical protein
VQARDAMGGVLQAPGHLLTRTNAWPPASRPSMSTTPRPTDQQTQHDKAHATQCPVGLPTDECKGTASSANRLRANRPDAKTRQHLQQGASNDS